MGKEIERKFLLRNDEWRREVAETLVLHQGYLTTEPRCTVRVRVSGDSAWLTIKGAQIDGVAPEFEYSIPEPDAHAMLASLAKLPLVEKKRHLIPRDGVIWEVDEFLGDNAGLVIAEIELATPDQVFPLPSWIDREVTGKQQYYNASLVSRPFSSW